MIFCKFGPNLYFVKNYFWALVLFLSLSCGKKKDLIFSVRGFNPITNFQQGKSFKNISLDYDSAFLKGFVIPSVRQTSNGQFNFEFEVINNTDVDRTFYYKIYYQNKSYKFPEGHPFEGENFYGSWVDVTQTFKGAWVTKGSGWNKVTGSFQIVGNPRDEKKYFSGFEGDLNFTQYQFNKTIEAIYNTPEWIGKIKAKAAERNLSVQAALEDDALFTLIDNANKKTINNRWKRNPRVGEYEFMLVVSAQEDILEGKIPENMQNIGLTEKGKFENPFGFFLSEKGNKLKNTQVFLSDTRLKVSAKVPLNGIYTTPVPFKFKTDSSAMDSNCGHSENLYVNAGFEQFFHQVDTSVKMDNVVAVADLANFSKAEYLKMSDKPRKKIPISITDCPCKTVNAGEEKLTFHNPGTSVSELKKENVGLATRHGFTYGKFRAKVKFNPLLNKDQVWSGLTNAVWMINQSFEANTRRACLNEGYIPKHLNGRGAKRQRTLTYSEIDFEIVKDLEHWPANSYPDKKEKAENPANKDAVMVTCTNWDLACRDPKDFEVGAFPVKYKDQTFIFNRWDDWYQAMTSKTPVKDDELFSGPYYYFEIEWTPTSIIWRIGPEKNKLRIVSFADESVTSVPNNQMVMVFTQEYHHAQWWPGAPFNQNNIPAPLKDLPGEILEVEIE